MDKIVIIAQSYLVSLEVGDVGSGKYGYGEIQTDYRPIQIYRLSCMMPNCCICGSCIINTSGLITFNYITATYKNNNEYISGDVWCNISGVIKVQ